MNAITLFHTVDDRSNPEEVNAQGPFVCDDESAWLGIGYYFWDSDIDLAHWWGRSHYQGKYMICQAQGKMDDRCLDLLDGNQRLRFKEKCKEFLIKMDKRQEDVFVHEMLTLWINLEGDIFNSVRAVPTSPDGFSIKRAFRIIFSNNPTAFLDFNLPVQVCLYDKKALSLNNFRVVHPTYYLEWDFA
jgi:hypothetical protein